MRTSSPLSGLIPRRIILRLSLLATAMSVPGIAHADGADFRDIIIDIINSVLPLWVPVAILVVVIAGFTMLVSTREEGLGKGRSTIIAVAIGGMMIMLGPVLVTIMYQSPGFVMTNTAPALNAEALGVVGWLSAMGGMLGVLLVIVGAARAVASFGGNESGYAEVRQAILNTVLGLIFIASGVVIHDTMFSGLPNPLIQLIVGKVLIVLGIATTAAVGVLVYAGIRMVANFGNEESFTQSRSLAVRVIAGLVVMLVSYTVVIFVANAFS